MKKLISLPVTKRAGKATSGNVLFDALDITSPVRDFTTYRSVMVRESETSVVEYQTPSTFNQIKALHPSLVELTVSAINGRNLPEEKAMLFCVDRISGAVRPSGTNSVFFYREEPTGNAHVEYVVSHSINTINNRLNNISDGTGNTDYPITTKVTLTAAQIKTLNSIPVELLPLPGDNVTILLLNVSTKLNFGTVPFDFMNDLVQVYADGQDPATEYQYQEANLLSGAQSRFGNGGLNVAPLNSLSPNKRLMMTAAQDATVGDSTMDVYITYTYIQ